MPRRDDNNPLTLAIAAIVASVLIHGVLWPLGDRVLGLGWASAPMPKASGVIEVALIPQAPALDTTDSEDKIVRLDRVVEERPPENDTHQLSEFDNRVPRQTRAPNQRARAGAAPQRPGDPSDPANAEAPPSPDPSAKSLPLAARIPAADAGHAIDEADAARLQRGEDKPAGAPRPAGGLRGSPGAFAKTFGAPGSLDSLDEIEPGDENLLNSKRYKYASFFNRVRDAVAQHWKPAEVHRAQDPDGRVFGAKTRRTNLVIRLNADGSLAKIMLAGSSEAEHLDEEAIRAVRRAAPFDNPPEGLVDPSTGFIEFGFGFIFELRGRTRIFRYQR